jgi:hypothetical protein
VCLAIMVAFSLSVAFAENEKTGRGLNMADFLCNLPKTRTNQVT